MQTPVKYLAAILILLTSAWAQSTTVTGQVKDANGAIYTNATININFINPSNLAANWNGFPLTVTTWQGNADSFGNFSLVVPDLNSIAPATGTYYTVKACANTQVPPGQPSNPCGILTTPACPTSGCITGSSISITTALTAVMPILTTPGTGTVTVSGPVTAGHIATFSAPTVIQDGGTGGAGNSATPQNSIQVAGPASAFISGGVRYVNATNYAWTQSPASNLTTPGSNTITLAPCPLGVDGTDTWNYVHIGTQGTPEDVLITGGTCISGAGSGTITVTTANAHSAGYTVASSTQGWQEASNDARFTPTNPTGSVQSGHVVGSPGEYTWTATMTVHTQNQTLDFSGTIINCNMSASCLLVGSTANAFTSQNTHVYNFRGRPMIANGTYAMIEDNGNGSVFDGVYTRNGLSGGTFGTDIQIDNDQAVDISHVDSSLGSPNIRCDATFCGAVITAPGPFATFAAVGYVHDSNLTLNCAFNGIDWQSGNTLRVSNTVVQGYAQFGIRTGVIRGGFGPSQLDNVYEEAGACSNPSGNIGQAGAIAAGQTITIHGGECCSGNFPVFNNQGGTQRNYYVVEHDTVSGVTTPLPIGTGTPTSGTVTLTWPQIPNCAGVCTYDVLATSGVPNAITPVAPNGTANQAVHGAVGISGSCSAGVCTATDTFATPLDSYTVMAVTNAPFLTYWPGGLILSAGAIAFQDATVGYTISTTVNGVSVFAHRCSNTVQFQDLWSSCIGGDPVGTNSRTAAMVLDSSTDNSGGGLTGRIDFATNRTSIVGPSHFITLVDSSPLLTIASPTMRRAYSALDTYIGTDTVGNQNPSSTSLAFGNPVQISNYINSNPDNSSWLERLTSTTKTFKVPIATPAATLALSTASIGAHTCAAAQTATLTGATTASVVKWSFASTPIGVTGYGDAVTPFLIITTFATANTANVVVCNTSAGAITPGSMTLNLRLEE